MDITIHASFLPHDDPDASLAFYRDTLGFEVRNDVEYGGMPSRAAYTALAVSTSETGCSTVLMPWVEEAVMVAPVSFVSMAATLGAVR